MFIFQTLFHTAKLIYIQLFFILHIKLISQQYITVPTTMIKLYRTRCEIFFHNSIQLTTLTIGTSLLTVVSHLLLSLYKHHILPQSIISTQHLSDAAHQVEDNNCTMFTLLPKIISITKIPQIQTRACIERLKVFFCHPIIL